MAMGQCVTGLDIIGIGVLVLALIAAVQVRDDHRTGRLRSSRPLLAKPALERGWEEHGCYCVGFVWIFSAGCLYAKMDFPVWAALALGVPASMAICAIIAVSYRVLLVFITYLVRSFTK